MHDTNAEAKFAGNAIWTDEPVKRDARPYESAFEQAMKELAVLRDAVVCLRGQIKPALQPELTTEAPTGESNPKAPESPVVRDFGALRDEARNVTSLVRSISDRVHL